jgi:hypothetical protein
MDNQARINQLEEENAKLKEELQSVKEHLKKYTAPASSKVYYEKHKEIIKQRVKECREKTNYISTISPEKKKEYNKQAYLRRKEKLKKKIEETKSDENIVE